jgi:hypothetical protein
MTVVAEVIACRPISAPDSSPGCEQSRKFSTCANVLNPPNDLKDQKYSPSVVVFAAAFRLIARPQSAAQQPEYGEPETGAIRRVIGFKCAMRSKNQAGEEFS